MWWVKDEEGATAITVALMLLVIFGIGALVLDAGNLFWERRQLQNAADAAALAAAWDYALGESEAVAHESARTFTSANSTRASFLERFEPNLTAQEVSVTTHTGTEDEPFLIAWLAGVIGHDQYATRASATARWGGAALGPTVIPLSVSMCDFMGGPGPYSPAELDAHAASLPTVDELPRDGDGNVTGGQIIVMHEPGDPDACTFSPGFAAEDETKMPAGFGWLELDNPKSACRVNITQYESDGQFWVPTRGGTYPEGKTCLEANYRRAPLIPVFTGFESAPVKEYRLYAPASFYITGLHMPPGAANPPGMTCPGGGGVWCIRGHFVQKVEHGAPIGGPSLGVTAIELSG